MYATEAELDRPAALDDGAFRAEVRLDRALECDAGPFTREAMAVANDCGPAMAHRARFARLADDHAA